MPVLWFKQGEEAKLMGMVLGVGLERFLAYSKWRRGQEKATKSIYEHLKEGGVVVFEAPTGYGKTAAALASSLKLTYDEGLKTVFLVRTKNQLIQPFKEARALYLKGSLPHPFALFKNRQEMCALKQFRDLVYEEFIEKCRVLRESERCPFATALERRRVLDLFDEAIKKCTSPSHYIAYITAHGICPYEFQRALSIEAKLILASYNYIFEERIRRPFIANTHLFPRRTVLIMDEAHNLPFYLANLYSRSITEATIRKCIREAREFLKAPELTVQTLRSLLTWMKSVRIPKDGFREVSREEILAVIGNWSELLRALKALRTQAIRAGAYGLASSSLIEFFDSLERREEYVLTMRSVEGLRALEHRCFFPGSECEEVFEFSHSSILMSATMPSKEFLASMLSIPLQRLAMVSVEEGYGRVLMGIANDVTSRYTERSDATYRRMSEYIASLYHSVDGVVLIMAPSYEFAKSIRTMLMEMGISDILVERQDTSLSKVKNTIKSYLEAGKKILILAVAGGKLVEGIEIKIGGVNVVKYIVIAGIPYPEPDVLTLRQREVLSRLLGDYEKGWEFAFEEPALMKIYQAVGRGLRSPKDEVLLLILDNRALRERILNKLRRKYGEPVIISSPLQLSALLKAFSSQ